MKGKVKVFATIFLALLHCVVHAQPTTKLKNILKINFEDDPHQFYLSHRTCFVFMIGLDWIHDALEKAIVQQVDSFTLNQQRRLKKGEFEEKLRSTSWSATYNATSPSRLSYNGSCISVKKEVIVTSKQREVSLSFKAWVGLELQADEQGAHHLWPPPGAEITEWSCKPSHFMLQSGKFNSAEHCDKLKRELESYRLVHLLFQDLQDYNYAKKHYTKFFELHFAPQIIAGLLESIDDFDVAIPSDKRVVLDRKRKRVDVMLNCNQKSVDAVRSYTSGNDTGEFQVSLMQNIVESVLVDDWYIRVKDFEFLDEKIVWKIAQESGYTPLIDERVSIVKSQAEIEQYMDDPMQPHLRTKKRFAVHHHGDVMDRTALYQSLFFKVDEPTGEYGATYFKVEGILDFIHVLKRGIGSRFGPSQELKS